MSEGDNEKYVFDFETEVARAKSDYPAETKNITFLDLSKPESRAQAIKWLKNTSPEFKSLLTTKNLSNAFDQLVLLMGGAFYLRDSITQRSLLCAHSAPPLKVSGTDKDGEALFQFNHELGHLVVPGGSVPVGEAKGLATNPAKQQFVINRTEIAADCFAVLRGFSQATFSDADADSLALMRALSALKDMDLIHLSTQGIDQIRIDAHDGNITSLTPREIKAIARDHAKKFRLSETEVTGSSAEAIFLKSSTPEEKLKIVQDLDITSPLRYAFSRLLATDFKVSGKNGASFTNGSAEFLENAHDILAAEIDALGMKRIVSLAPAEKDISEHSAAALAFATLQQPINSKASFSAYIKAILL